MRWNRCWGSIEVSHRVALHGSKVVGYECEGVKCSGKSLYLVKLGAQVLVSLLTGTVVHVLVSRGSTYM